MINIGLDGVPPAPPVTFDSSREEIQEFNNALEPVYTEVFGAIYSNVELPEGLTNETKTIIGDDGNEIKLYITKPINATEEMPGILHLHGGGMAIMKAGDPNYIYWRHKLASKGLVVVGLNLETQLVFLETILSQLGSMIVFPA